MSCSRSFMLKPLGILIAIFFGFHAPASAVLTIDVTKGVVAPISIAIVPFHLDDDIEEVESITGVIDANLVRSGYFEPIPSSGFLSMPHEFQSVRYKDWRLLKAEILVIGKVTRVDDTQYEVQFRLLDVFREQQLIGRKFTAPVAQWRQVAHRISDIIYEKVLGKSGAFDTSIAYVAVHGKPPTERFFVQVADVDGHNPKTILETPQPIISLAWSPDGNTLAYVSFEVNRSAVYIQNIWSGSRQKVASFKGINSAPAWSSDSARLALTLSKEGNAEIYIYHLKSGSLKRLTHHIAIDTEPAWSPDDRSIVFTSNRAGTVQIYQIPTTGGEAKRLTFGSKYNAAASYSSDGKFLALITNRGQGFRVGVYSFSERSILELTKSTQDESPTWSPNDESIMYATQIGGRKVIAMVSVDGRVQQTLQLGDHDILEPVWSPVKIKL